MNINIVTEISKYHMLWTTRFDNIKEANHANNF